MAQITLTEFTWNGTKGKEVEIESENIYYMEPYFVPYHGTFTKLFLKGAETYLEIKESTKYIKELVESKKTAQS